MSNAEEKNNMGKGKEAAAPVTVREGSRRLSDRAAAQLAQKKADDAAANIGRMTLAEYEAARAARARAPVELLPGDDPAKVCDACPPGERQREYDW